ncbi:tRNA-binding protein [Candidatus Marsarchaeota archaeon]|nr:tRNA-binding protein [Candidatus Marsarchaeota archaeon]MCL5405104.1 tRNA-binding protein [Candidatus Marsarchaeota archaeon]
MIEYKDFEKVDMRVGIIIKVEDFPEAKKPAYKLTIDFGEGIGIKRSSAQITNYRKEDLIGRKVVAVANFPPKQVANFISEVLVLGAITSGGVKLLSIYPDAPPGSRIG